MTLLVRSSEDSDHSSPSPPVTHAAPSVQHARTTAGSAASNGHACLRQLVRRIEVRPAGTICRDCSSEFAWRRRYATPHLLVGIFEDVDFIAPSTLQVLVTPSSSHLRDRHHRQDRQASHGPISGPPPLFGAFRKPEKSGKEGTEGNLSRKTAGV